MRGVDVVLYGRAVQRARVTPYERVLLAVALLANTAALLLTLLSDGAADQRFAVTLTFFSAGIVIAVLVLRAERGKDDGP